MCLLGTHCMWIILASCHPNPPFYLMVWSICPRWWWGGCLFGGCSYYCKGNKWEKVGTQDSCVLRHNPSPSTCVCARACIALAPSQLPLWYLLIFFFEPWGKIPEKNLTKKVLANSSPYICCKVWLFVRKVPLCVRALTALHYGSHPQLSRIFS